MSEQLKDEMMRRANEQTSNWVACVSVSFSFSHPHSHSRIISVPTHTRRLCWVGCSFSARSVLPTLMHTNTQTADNRQMNEWMDAGWSVALSRSVFSLSVLMQMVCYLPNRSPIRTQTSTLPPPSCPTFFPLLGLQFSLLYSNSFFIDWSVLLKMDQAGSAVSGKWPFAFRMLKNWGVPMELDRSGLLLLLLRIMLALSTQTTPPPSAQNNKKKFFFRTLVYLIFFSSLLDRVTTTKGWKNILTFEITDWRSSAKRKKIPPDGKRRKDRDNVQNRTFRVGVGVQSLFGINQQPTSANTKATKHNTLRDVVAGSVIGKRPIPRMNWGLVNKNKRGITKCLWVQRVCDTRTTNNNKKQVQH